VCSGRSHGAHSASEVESRARSKPSLREPGRGTFQLYRCRPLAAARARQFSTSKTGDRTGFGQRWCVSRRPHQSQPVIGVTVRSRARPAERRSAARSTSSRPRGDRESPVRDHSGRNGIIASDSTASPSRSTFSITISIRSGRVRARREDRRPLSAAARRVHPARETRWRQIAEGGRGTRSASRREGKRRTVVPWASSTRIVTGARAAGRPVNKDAATKLRAGADVSLRSRGAHSDRARGERRAPPHGDQRQRWRRRGRLGGGEGAKPGADAPRAQLRDARILHYTAPSESPDGSRRRCSRRLRGAYSGLPRSDVGSTKPDVRRGQPEW